jgi:ribosomal protein S18 acetylase RimI-like enzyme
MSGTWALTFRTAGSGDIPGIRFVDPLMRADRARAQLIASALQNGDCIVAARGDEIVGFAILNYTFFDQGFVPLLVVGAGSRRSGVGTALLAELERRCAKPKLYVSTNESNVPAQCLFEKCGFAPSGRIENLDLDDAELLYFKHVVAAAPKFKEDASSSHTIQ